MGRTGRCQLISSSCLGWQCGRPWSLPTRAPASQHLLRLAVADTPRRDRAHGGPARGRAVGHRRPLRTVVRPGLFAALRSIKSTPPPRGWRQTPNPIYYLGLQPLGLSEMAKQTTRPGTFYYLTDWVDNGKTKCFMVGAGWTTRGGQSINHSSIWGQDMTWQVFWIPVVIATVMSIRT